MNVILLFVAPWPPPLTLTLDGIIFFFEKLPPQEIMLSLIKLNGRTLECLYRFMFPKTERRDDTFSLLRNPPPMFLLPYEKWKSSDVGRRPDSLRRGLKRVERRVSSLWALQTFVLRVELRRFSHFSQGQINENEDIVIHYSLNLQRMREKVISFGC